jgi:hypothetical protein
VSPDGVERRRWWARPWRLVYAIVLALGQEPKTRAHHLWRDLVPAICLVALGLYGLGLADKVDRNTVDARVAKIEASTAKRLAEAQSNGRRISLGVTCGALRGVEDAGRLVLTQRLPGTERFYPPSSARAERVREAVARAYNRVITDRIVREAGVNGERVIEPNGSVNCDRLREVARAPKPAP